MPDLSFVLEQLELAENKQGHPQGNENGPEIIDKENVNINPYENPSNAKIGQFSGMDKSSSVRRLSTGSVLGESKVSVA